MYVRIYPFAFGNAARCVIVTLATLALQIAWLAAPLGAQELAPQLQPHTAAEADSTTPRPARAGRVQKTFFVRRDLAYSGVAIVTSAVVSHFDVRVAHWARGSTVQGDSSRKELVSTLTRLNETPLTIAAAATYGIGRLTHSATTADVGLHTFEALVLTTGVSEVIRGVLGRTRPRAAPNDQYDFDVGSGFTNFETRSYPSLHTAAAFATATALVGEIRERKPEALKYAAPLLYAGAMAPGLTRVYLDQHWASDIVAGAFLGALMGSRVVSYAHSHKRTRLDRMLLGVSAMPDGRGGALVMVNVRR
jgi:membrane-associated phospholipid phosphatase